ncbi:MAG: peptidase domain-containing ABC transporter [Chitinophagaceae bacterium]|jgi:ATP-binding cassette subfamily B protein|nr:peptidase domain-containing ABC transporter [Chitinophagaceae bacterium]
MPKFSFFKQQDAMDCGPTCLRMVSKYYGKSIAINHLRNLTEIGKEGVNLLGISYAAEKQGFRTRQVKISFNELLHDAPLPAIIHWGQNHFVVLTPNSKLKKIEIADPAKGLLKYTKKEFLQFWASTTNGDEELGIALLLEPTPAFYETNYLNEFDETTKGKAIGWQSLLQYFLQQKKYIVQLVLGLLVGSLLQLILPFLTQSIVDTGIQTHNLQFIYIILFAQFALFFGRTTVEFIRSKILLHISTKVNLSILSDFWIKLMKLPLSYFDTKQTGDIIQRLGDHRRIESFLTGSALSTLFSLFNLVIFSFVMLQYNVAVFFIFLMGSLLYFLWIKIFLQFRRNLDFKRFAIAAKENTATMQLIYGMQEIKLNNVEHLRRWEWESLQAGLFKLSYKSLSLSQYQQAGAFFINEGKNILITFFVAKSVIDGQLTLGAMLAVQYIIGQLNSPVEQLIGFIQQAQDAKISLERLNEIHELEEEEPNNKQFIEQLPNNKTISFNKLSFTYPGAGNEPVLQQVDLQIAQGKVTAIVGMSGSGKTTLLKLLLKFYDKYNGEIKIGETNLKNISPRFWRSQCGSVMQDGFIFNDTIANNIAVSDANPNYEKLVHACTVANILPFIESLPLGFNTKIGAEGNGISQGQKQRLLIARAVYKNPTYLFFDEATNSLDANNEKIILENLQDFFKNKTVIVVAHRLSTVKNADNIIVLHKGVIIEQGTHIELTNKRGEYYELVKNQLELGN